MKTPRFENENTLSVVKKYTSNWIAKYTIVGELNNWVSHGKGNKITQENIKCNNVKLCLIA